MATETERIILEVGAKKFESQLIWLKWLQHREQISEEMVCTIIEPTEAEGGTSSVKLSSICSTFMEKKEQLETRGRK